ncbi:LysR family transcriptional regulator [Acidovorax sp.]|uniref:LysR family transcriptional regulator n=1 Tax=Acidovorax sp. TaxID=1872122 RepID=UPI00391FA4BA
MHATFRQLRLLIALAETRSITAAARACHVTQPTVSMQIKELADAVGLPLHEQIGRNLYLTPAGEAVAESARAMVAEWEGLEQRIAGLKGLRQGRLRIALASTAKYFIPRMLGRFCASYPDVDIELQVLNRDGVVHRMRSNQDDLYILSLPPEDIPHDRLALLDNPLVPIAAFNHSLATSTRIRSSRLQSEPFILRERGSGTRMAGDAHFKRLDLSPRVRLELGSNEAIKQSVAAGMGLGLVSRHALAGSPETEGLAVLKVNGFPVPSSWSVLWLKGKRLSPLAGAFLGHLQEVAIHWEVHS